MLFYPGALCLLATFVAVPSSGQPVGNELARLPSLKPDYVGIEIPPNIAPLNFYIDEPAARYQVEISSRSGPPISIASRNGKVMIPPHSWRTLLQANRGERLLLAVSIQAGSGPWTRFQTITNTISRDEMDGYLAYRRLHPVFSRYGTGNLGIFQRNLQSFEESPILEVKERTRENPWCMNCHTFQNRRPENFSLHLRSHSEKSMLLVREGKVAKVDLPAGYMSWHPTGKLLVYSQNKLSLFFHSIGETRDVFDANSDLAVYYPDANRTASPAPIAQTNRLENWPMWSPDGEYLYFSSAAPLPFEQYKSIRYDLMRVHYDVARDEWGAPETLVKAADLGRSLLQPRPSPDGRFLVFTACDYGHFPIYQTNSMQHLLDLKTHQHWLLEVNSGCGETWHSWSGNSRWLVFSSKRLSRLTARPFFSHIDEHGHASKPFVLPQEDPLFYDSFLKTFNVPEFVVGPVVVPERALLEALGAPPSIKPAGAEPVFQQSGESGE